MIGAATRALDAATLTGFGLALAGAAMTSGDSAVVERAAAARANLAVRSMGAIASKKGTETLAPATFG